MKATITLNKSMQSPGKNNTKQYAESFSSLDRRNNNNLKSEMISAAGFSMSMTSNTKPSTMVLNNPYIENTLQSKGKSAATLSSRAE